MLPRRTVTNWRRWVSVVVMAFPAWPSSGGTAEIVLQNAAQIEVSAAVYSPDGKVIAAGGDSDTIRLWDRGTGELVRTLPGHPERVVGAAFSPDGTMLASSSTDGLVKLWDYRQGRLLYSFTNNVGNWARRVAFSPDSRLLSAASYDGTVDLWDTHTGKTLLALPVGGRTADLVFTPDGGWLITASREDDGPVIEFWDTKSGRRGLVITNSHSFVAISVSADGRRLVSGDVGKKIVFWELPSGRRLREFATPENEDVMDVDFSPDGQTVAYSSYWYCRVIDAESLQVLSDLRGQRELVTQISFSPDGAELVTGSGDATVRQWKAKSGEMIREIGPRPPASPITSIAFSPNGEFEAVSGVDGVVRVWDAGRPGTFLHSLRAHEGAVYALAFDRQSKWLFSGGIDRSMRVWLMENGTLAATYPLFDRGDPITTLAPGGKEELTATASGPWATGGAEHAITLWRTHNDRPSRRLLGHQASVQALAYARGQNLLASVSSDGVVKLWDTILGACLQTKTNSVKPLTLAFDPSERLLAIGAQDGTVQFLNTNDLSVARSWRAHERPVRSLSFSADGRWLATASPDRSVAIWDVAAGTELRRYTNVTSQYLPVAFHPTRPEIAFAQQDQMVVHADILTGLTIFQRIHFPDGEWLAWNPGKAFYMASSEGERHARLRLENQLTPVYPLQLYREELNRPTNLLAALGGPAPVLEPKNFQLWWFHYPHKNTWLYALIIAGSGLAGWSLWQSVVSERRRRFQELFSRRLLQSQEDERKRIAGELHDSLGQNLQIIKNRAMMGLNQKEVPDALAMQLREISGGATRAIAEVRAITHALRPAELDQAGLTQAIEWLIDEVAQGSGLEIERAIEPVDGLLSADEEVNLYRITQEALTNVVKHADATRVVVELKRMGSQLELSLFDNGKGIAPAILSGAQPRKGLGMTGMAERARFLGGRAEIQSTEGKGTRLTVTVRISQPEGSKERSK